MSFKIIKYFLRSITLPKSNNEDDMRREFILNILLSSSIIFVILGILLHVVRFLFLFQPFDFESYKNSTLPFLGNILLLSFFLFLFVLSRKKFFRFASYLFLGSFFLLSIYMIFQWGVELPPTLLFFVLIIIMSSILINTRFAFFVTIFLSLVTFFSGYAQVNNIISPNLYWKSKSLTITDVIMFVLIYFVIVTVSWLSNREIEKSLKRARKSEAELKIERDSLEVKVEERTKELKEIQSEKMTQMYRFAEFGRLSSGLFHDLINPLNAVSLNIEKVRSQNKDNDAIPETKMYLDKAISASKKMEDFIIAIRRQIARQGNMIMFSLTKEIEQIIEVISHKAMKANVKIIFSTDNKEVEIFGDAIKFNQVILNLIANAIDAYALSNDRKEKNVFVSLKQENGVVILLVKDNGVGIKEENIQKIFEPFFTTKDGSGMGIGLSMVKRIVEKDFNGKIEVDSEINKGTTFIITIPNKFT